MKFLSGVYWGRMAEHSRNPLLKRAAAYISRRLLARRGIELVFNGNIGERLQLGHAWGITVNARAVIGDDCVLFKGCTICSIRSGKREGVPKLGNRVVVGCNAFVCGGITVGDDVLIAANAFVNFDVPSNSVVIGNPGQIHHKNNPCKDYVLR